MSGAIEVAGVAVPVIEQGGLRLVTLAMVDKVHQRPDGTAGRNFREHRDRLVLGEDYVRLSSDEIRRSCPGAIPDANRMPELLLLTESGYLMLVKSFNDDLAWQVQRALVKGYFRPAPIAPALPQSFAEALRLAADAHEEAERARGEVEQRDATIAVLEPRSAALMRLVEAKGALNLTEASKALQERRCDLQDMMVEHRWIYRRAGAGQWLGYADKVQQGLLTHKVGTVPREDGSEKIVEQVRITAKGMAKLAVMLEGRS